MSMQLFIVRVHLEEWAYKIVNLSGNKLLFCLYHHLYSYDAQRTQIPYPYRKHIDGLVQDNSDSIA